MSTEIIFAILLASLIILLLMGAEVFVAVSVTSAIGLIFFVGQGLPQFLFTAFITANSLTLTALPLFVFMGGVFSGSGIVGSLLRGAERWFDRLPGGVPISVIAANGIFGALCGSTVAATATFGEVAFPEMEKLGYKPRITLGSIVVGGILSAAIPPSLTLIVYGAFSETSVARLFAAVLIPGIILMSMFIITVILLVKLDPSLAPPSVRFTWRDRILAVKDLAPWIFMLVAILGVIFAGIMSPTEAAALGALLSMGLALLYRRMTFNVLKSSALTAVRITAMAIFLLFTAKVLGQVFQHVGLVDLFSNFMKNLPFGKYGTLFVIGIVYIIGGMFLHEWALMVITLPFVLPLLQTFGISFVWFGIFFIMIGETGLITPPFGMNLFALHGVVRKHDVMEIGISALPFLVPMLLTGVLITIFPNLALWLPNLLYTR